ncbi:MliC family protein [Deinococcus radiophilus]|nr:MliC family protein [Deinococcus radiophilus]UFA51255.1 MliC family protein [Deinococcus radiophilus]
MFTQLFRTLMAAALLSSPALLGGTALAGGAGAPPVAVQPAFTWIQCQGGRVLVRYVQAHDLTFVVLRYQGQNYGLAPAVSASGSRYVGLAGLDTASGLEWWEHQGEGTLSVYHPASGETAPLLAGCRLRR